ncbi:hypothetical protein LZ30DRAFT_288130 [Colletotrichum cereale]|nr:hypothetical protein LZ30DRAFT_288130 [Colletotrichum cereale]
MPGNALVWHDVCQHRITGHTQIAGGQPQDLGHGSASGTADVFLGVGSSWQPVRALLAKKKRGLTATGRNDGFANDFGAGYNAITMWLSVDVCRTKTRSQRSRERNKAKQSDDACSGTEASLHCPGLVHALSSPHAHDTWKDRMPFHKDHPP